MRALTGGEVRQALRGRWLSRNEPIPIRGVSIDSRTAQSDDLFVAVRGNTFDGHVFLSDAADAGCVAAVVDLKAKVPGDLMSAFPAGVIGVEDTRTALLDLGGYYRSLLPATVVAVTGSNGKTTVKRMIEHILRTRLHGTCSPKSFNNEVGVPLTLLSAGMGDDYVICEVGASAPGEISRLARAIRPNISVITGIGPAHLEGFKTVEQIAVEKSMLLGWMGPRDVAVVSADYPALDYALRSYESRLIRFGDRPEAQFRLTAYESDGRRQRFQINGRDWVELPLPGRHNALNALAAIAVAVRIGVAKDEAHAALADFVGVEMRLETIEAGGIHVINDAYNANPASVAAAADVLCESRAKRRVMIVGDMLELGEQSEALHVETGRRIAQRRLDLIVAVGPRAAALGETAGRAGNRTVCFAGVQEAAEGLKDLLSNGDLVLLKGSRAMGMEALIPAIRRIGDRPSAAAKPTVRKKAPARARKLKATKPTGRNRTT